MSRTAGDTKRQGSPQVREYRMEVCVTVYQDHPGRWLCEDHLGRIESFPTQALAELYAEGAMADWAKLIREN